MSVRLERINLENAFTHDIATNNGFIINNEQDQYAPVNVDQLINSSKYMDVEYRCDCGAFTGQDIIGRICPRCNSEISLRSLNFKYTGWIDISPHKVITPIYYEMIKRTITPNMLKYILGDYKADYSVPYNENDTNFMENKKNRKTGRLAQNDIAAIKKKIPKAKYIYEGIGHDEFYNRFEEIITACCKNDAELDTLLREKESVFSSKIPVYSTAFRPVSKTSETMFYPKINKSFSQIVAIQCKLKDMALPIEVIQALNFIQNYWIDATEYLITNEVAKKDGFVRSEIVGGTFSFSARGVIILDISLADDQVDLPVPMCITAYQYKITHIISRRYNMTLEQSYLYVRDWQIHPDVVSILNEILESSPQWIMLLREPANNLASIEILRIRRAKLNDDTISLPPEILPGFNADFDGDQLNALFLGSMEDGIVQEFLPFHRSYMTNYVTEKVSLPLLDWANICLSRMTI